MGSSTFSKISQVQKVQAVFGITLLSLLAYFEYQHHKNVEQQQKLQTQLKNMFEQKFLKEINEENICAQLKQKKEYPIYKIAITGGPCGGKTSSLQNIRDHFTKKGFKVLCVPQVPTIVSLGGGFLVLKGQKPADKIKFQTYMMKLKIALQDYITKIGQMSQEPCIVICDRGMTDFAAYMHPDLYQAMRDQQGWTWATLRDRRYDSVIFLNSAANGAQQFYTTANNAARTETVEEAKALDKRTLDTWIGHPHMTICPNIPGRPFKDKLQRALRSVQRAVGIEEADIIYQKFLILEPKFPPGMVVVQSQVEEHFLINNSKRYMFDKIKRRGQSASYTYQRKLVGHKVQGQKYREQIRKPLNSLQYELLIEQRADPNCNPVRLRRLNFACENSVYYSIDYFTNIYDQKEVYLLRFTTEPYQIGESLIPPFIQVVRDVREQHIFKRYNIATKSN